MKLTQNKPNQSFSFPPQEELLVDKNGKLFRASQEKKNLEAQLTKKKQNHQTTQNLVQQQQQTIANLNNQLAKKEEIIQQQNQRIKELEHKPPVIQTKKQEVLKEKENKVYTEYPVEIIQEKESEAQKKEIQKLNKIIQKLRTQLAYKSTPISQIAVRENLPKENNREREREELYPFFMLASIATICLFLLKIAAIYKNKTQRRSKQRKVIS